MKGIVLAGGAGTRLYPITLATSKQLLPVYDKPLIYYPISVLMLAGIRHILIITTPVDRPAYERVLGDGSQFGVTFSYAVQPAPTGIAEALIIAAEFLAGGPATLILGDNIFFGHGLSQLIAKAIDSKRGASVFAYHVEDPQRYGIVTFDDLGGALNIEEKPTHPVSSWAITGLYVYDRQAVEKVRLLNPSSRGELEITDLNRSYLRDGELNVVRLGRGYAWLDAGTHDSLLEASNFIRAIEIRQGMKIGCLEEIALQSRWITVPELERVIADRRSSTYFRYLERILSEYKTRRPS